MGRVAITFIVRPESPQTDVKKIEKEIRRLFDSVQEVRVEDIAFGMKQLSVLMVFEDRKGADTDVIENTIAGIDGVSSVEQGDVTLI